ncbi:hypothetical protein CXG81DRAFT_24394 [Caulochytrium protostelioides]|uniref:Uncharacterized protein n=1 Tax=Caulochytrium protostelioides TaxID=1555241 RepID=A0A4V1IV66_9FUNG|nr:hypothetical protein CXG81DRAFT_24394 [Caulochytrium protostelioides]|eukprot:RKP02989.1 hypothetical protein CXG81DRAFT_24394 [Caulochytrium protostelioides]
MASTRASRSRYGPTAGDAAADADAAGLSGLDTPTLGRKRLAPSGVGSGSNTPRLGEADADELRADGAAAAGAAGATSAGADAAARRSDARPAHDALAFVGWKKRWITLPARDGPAPTLGPVRDHEHKPRPGVVYRWAKDGPSAPVVVPPPLWRLPASESAAAPTASPTAVEAEPDAGAADAGAADAGADGVDAETADPDATPTDAPAAARAAADQDAPRPAASDAPSDPKAVAVPTETISEDGDATPRGADGTAAAMAATAEVLDAAVAAVAAAAAIAPSGDKDTVQPTHDLHPTLPPANP